MRSEPIRTRYCWLLILIVAAAAACGGEQAPADSCRPWEALQGEGSDDCLLVMATEALDTRRVAYSADGDTLYMLAYFLEQRDASTGERLSDCQECSELKLALSDAVFTPAGDVVGVSSGNVMYYGAEPLGARIFGEDYLAITDMAYVPHWDAILIAHDDGLAWRAMDGTLLSNVSLGQTVTSVAVAPDSSAYAVALGDSSLIIQPFAESSQPLDLAGHTAPVRSLAYSPDGALLAAGDEAGEIKLWQTATGALAQTLSGHTGRVNAVTFSPDGSRLASGSDDGTARIWPAAGGGSARQMWSHGRHGVWDVAFSPDSARLAVGLGWDSEFETDPAFANAEPEFVTINGPVVIWQVGE